MDAVDIVYDDAIITSLVRYGEYDCIVRALSKTHGRFSAYVKNGLKQSKSRGSIIQAPAFAKVGVRFTQSGDGLAKISRFDVHPNTYLLATNLRNFGLFCYLTELVEIFVAEHDIHNGLYELLESAFEQLTAEDFSQTATLLRSFEIKLLALVGYLPDLYYVVGSREGAQEAIAYDADSCQFFAEHKPGFLHFSEEARCVALKLLHNSFASLPNCEDGVLRIVSRVFVARLRKYEKNMRSIKFLNSLGA